VLEVVSVGNDMMRVEQCTINAAHLLLLLFMTVLLTVRSAVTFGAEVDLLSMVMAVFLRLATGDRLPCKQIR
jgi:hypothetical protein